MSAESSPEQQLWIEQSQGLVRALAIKIHRKLPPHVSLDDVLSYGQVGLLQAANAFRSDMGTTFQTFAYYRIRGAIYDGLSKMTWASRAAQQRVRSEQIAGEVLRQQAEETNATPGQQERDFAAEAQWLVRSTEQVAMVQLLSSSNDPCGDALQSIEAAGKTPDEEVASDELQGIIRKLVAALPPLERQLIELTYFEGKTLTEAAEAMNRSKSWASRLHTRILEHLSRSAQLTGAS